MPLRSLLRRPAFLIAAAALAAVACTPASLRAETTPIVASGRLTGEVLLKSPDGKIEAHLGVAKDGRLAYTVTCDGRQVLGLSPLGLIVDGGDLGAGVKITGPVVVTEIDETYAQFGNRTWARNHAREALIPVESAGKKSGVVLRVYDDGVAVRYLLPADAVSIGGESTGWAFPDSATRAIYSESNHSYEGLTRAVAPEKLPAKGFLGPVTLELKETGAVRYLAITEADNESFPDMGFVREAGVIRATYPYRGKGWKLPVPDPESRAGLPDGSYRGFRASPWRATVIARDLTALVTSDLLMNLCPPAAGDFSWVKPGRSLWQWWSVGSPKFAEQKSWYDAAAAMKWEYYLIDDGWRRWKEGDKDQWALLREAIAYGESVGVKTLVWVDSKEMRVPEGRRAYLEKIRDCGAVGIKIDFIPDPTEEIMRWYLGGMKDCADLHLMLNYHGSVKPTGLRRTFPNDMTREAVRGNEWHLSRYKRVLPADQFCLIPFSRMLAGPADLTPVIQDPHELRGYTWANQYAQTVVFLSPLEHFCDRYSFYLASPVKDLLSEVPVVWDETRVLPCTVPGETVAFARRKGDTWWVGVMNAGEARTITLPLDFLSAPGLATCAGDVSGTDAAAERTERRVSPRDSLTLKLNPTGGFFARIRSER